MWRTKTFKTKETMQKFIDTHAIQWNEVFINHPPTFKEGISPKYAIEYRYLRIVY